MPSSAPLTTAVARAGISSASNSAAANREALLTRRGVRAPGPPAASAGRAPKEEGAPDRDFRWRDQPFRRRLPEILARGEGRAATRVPRRRSADQPPRSKQPVGGGHSRRTDPEFAGEVPDRWQHVARPGSSDVNCVSIDAAMLAAVRPTTGRILLTPQYHYCADTISLVRTARGDRIVTRRPLERRQCPVPTGPASEYPPAPLPPRFSTPGARPAGPAFQLRPLVDIRGRSRAPHRRVAGSDPVLARGASRRRISDARAKARSRPPAPSRGDRSIGFYERGLARIEDRWVGTGEPGDRFRDDRHLFANDLDLFGPGSLFELLSIARTRAGEETLAQWLKHPAPPDEIRARQEAISELTPASISGKPCRWPDRPPRGGKQRHAHPVGGRRRRPQTSMAARRCDSSHGDGRHGRRVCAPDGRPRTLPRRRGS